MVNAVDLGDALTDCPSRSLCSTSRRASGVSTGGRPIRFPSARARSWPWMLRSRMLLHSHSAMARVRCSRSCPGGGGRVELPL